MDTSKPNARFLRRSAITDAPGWHVRHHRCPMVDKAAGSTDFKTEARREKVDRSWNLSRLAQRDILVADMPKAPKRPRDLNQWAKRMVDIATGEAGASAHSSGR